MSGSPEKGRETDKGRIRICIRIIFPSLRSGVRQAALGLERARAGGGPPGAGQEGFVFKDLSVGNLKKEYPPSAPGSVAREKFLL